MCIHIYIYICIHTRIYIYTYTYIYIYTYIHFIQYLSANMLISKRCLFSQDMHCVTIFTHEAIAPQFECIYIYFIWILYIYIDMDIIKHTHTQSHNPEVTPTSATSASFASKPNVGGFCPTRWRPGPWVWFLRGWLGWPGKVDVKRKSKGLGGSSVFMYGDP